MSNPFCRQSHCLQPPRGPRWATKRSHRHQRWQATQRQMTTSGAILHFYALATSSVRCWRSRHCRPTMIYNKCHLWQPAYVNFNVRPANIVSQQRIHCNGTHSDAVRCSAPFAIDITRIRKDLICMWRRMTAVPNMLRLSWPSEKSNGRPKKSRCVAVCVARSSCVMSIYWSIVACTRASWVHYIIVTYAEKRLCHRRYWSYTRNATWLWDRALNVRQFEHDTCDII